MSDTTHTGLEEGLRRATAGQVITGHHQPHRRRTETPQVPYGASARRQLPHGSISGSGAAHRGRPMRPGRTTSPRRRWPPPEMRARLAPGHSGDHDVSGRVIAVSGRPAIAEDTACDIATARGSRRPIWNRHHLASNYHLIKEQD
jgi:hypothetical protein